MLPQVQIVSISINNDIYIFKKQQPSFQKHCYKDKKAQRPQLWAVLRIGFLGKCSLILATSDYFGVF